MSACRPDIMQFDWWKSVSATDLRQSMAPISDFSPSKKTISNMPNSKSTPRICILTTPDPRFAPSFSISPQILSATQQYLTTTAQQVFTQPSTLHVFLVNNSPLYAHHESCIYFLLSPITLCAGSAHEALLAGVQRGWSAPN